MIAEGPYRFPNHGVLFKRLPQDLFAEIKRDVANIQKDFSSATPYNKRLYGHLEKEFVIKNARLDQYVLDRVEEFNAHFNYVKSLDMVTEPLPFVVSTSWVNFQKKGEFNPNHWHNGWYSWVIWVNIPFDIEKERAVFPNVSSHAATSVFEFGYTNILGRIEQHRIPIDKSYEGLMCMFPSKMQHCVYPFYTSDDYRISMSGNVLLGVPPQNA